MRVAIMQPYLFPYIGYFQLMNAADEFIVYDNIEFSKKGWINRNRILVGGKDEYISFPLKKASDFLDIRDRSLADTWVAERKKILNKITAAYRLAPNFKTVFAVVEKAVLYDEKNLFLFILHSLEIVKQYLKIDTDFIVSSTLEVDHDLKAEKKVIALCKSRGATEYINPAGGLALYDKEIFKKEGINLQFLKTGNITYDQLGDDFVPSLSIIDVMMFNTKEKIKEYLDTGYTLL